MISCRAANLSSLPRQVYGRLSDTDMPDYMRDAFPHRHDHNRYMNALLLGLNTEYTENLELGYSGSRPGSGRHPGELDRIRVRAAIDACNRHISDRFWDFPSVRRLDRGFDRGLGLENNLRIARTLIENHAPRGAVKFIYNELWNDEGFSRARLSDQGNYNWAYSEILRWCGQHCYALPNYITRFANVAALGGGSSMPIIYQAASRLIREAYEARRGVYARYFIDPTIWSRMNPF